MLEIDYLLNVTLKMRAQPTLGIHCTTLKCAVPAQNQQVINLRLVYTLCRDRIMSTSKWDFISTYIVMVFCISHYLRFTNEALGALKAGVYLKT